MTGPLLTLRQAAEHVGHSTDAVRRAIRRGDLVASKPCGQLRIAPGDLEAWLQASRVAARPATRARPSRPAPSPRGAAPGSFRARARTG